MLSALITPQQLEFVAHLLVLPADERFLPLPALPLVAALLVVPPPLSSLSLSKKLAVGRLLLDSIASTCALMAASRCSGQRTCGDHEIYGILMSCARLQTWLNIRHGPKTVWQQVTLSRSQQ